MVVEIDFDDDLEPRIQRLSSTHIREAARHFLDSESRVVTINKPVP